MPHKNYQWTMMQRRNWPQSAEHFHAKKAAQPAFPAPTNRLLPTPNLYLRGSNLQNNLSTPDLTAKRPLMTGMDLHRIANTPSPQQLQQQRPLSSAAQINQLMAMKFPAYSNKPAQTASAQNEQSTHAQEEGGELGPNGQPSLMRQATERMKRRFLGWN